MTPVAELKGTNSRAVRAVAVLLGELLRSCQKEIIHLSGPDHALAFNRRLIEMVEESNVLTLLPDEQAEEVRASVMAFVENMIRLRRPRIAQEMTLENAALHAETHRRKSRVA